MNATLPAVGSRWDGLWPILPKLAQPFWYRLVGLQYAVADNPLNAVDVGCLAPDEKRHMRREARKRFKRSARAAIATAAKRKAKRRRELVTALRKVA